MKDPKPRVALGRPPVRREELLAMLRRKIVSGEAPPGSMLPLRSEFMAAHRVSSITIQKAFDQLVADGFVVARGKAGTWVAEHPPHLCRYGLAFSSNPGNATHWRGLDRAISRAAGEAADGTACSFRQYFDADQPGATQDGRRLLEDVKCCRLAGVVSTSGPTMMAARLRLESPLFPLVELSAMAVSAVPTVLLDLHSFFSEALDCLNERRRRRVAILTGVRYPGEVLKKVMGREVSARGMTVKPYWVHQIAVTDPATARGVMHLMMRGNPGDRPNGLIIADDNLAECAVAGILDAGARIPGDIEVVSEANFPLPPSAGLPVHRIGYAAPQILRACRTLIDEQRASGRRRVQRCIRLAAVRERDAAP